MATSLDGQLTNPILAPMPPCSQHKPHVCQGRLHCPCTTCLPAGLGPERLPQPADSSQTPDSGKSAQEEASHAGYPLGPLTWDLAFPMCGKTQLPQAW